MDNSIDECFEDFTETLCFNLSCKGGGNFCMGLCHMTDRHIINRQIDKICNYFDHNEVFVEYLDIIEDCINNCKYLSINNYTSIRKIDDSINIVFNYNMDNYDQKNNKLLQEIYITYNHALYPIAFHNTERKNMPAVLRKTAPFIQTMTFPINIAYYTLTQLMHYTQGNPIYQFNQIIIKRTDLLWCRLWLSLLDNIKKYYLLDVLSNEYSHAYNERYVSLLSYSTKDYYPTNRNFKRYTKEVYRAINMYGDRYNKLYDVYENDLDDGDIMIDYYNRRDAEEE